MSLKKIVLNAILILILIELTSFIGSAINLFTVNDVPFIYKGGIDLSGLKWRTENQDWGAWHKKNFSDRHVEKCFDVEYKTNSIGARDEEFEENYTDKRILILGDSMAEGYGMDYANSSTTILSHYTGIPTMNFGSGGNFGPVQYYLLYKNMAVKYNHSHLVIYFLPANDFTDNDIVRMTDNGQATHNTSRYRYRPYANLDYPYTIFYPKNSFKTDDYGMFSQGLKGDIKRFIVNYLWSSNPIKSLYLSKNNKSKITNGFGYYEDSVKNQKMAIFYIKKILDLAKNKQILIVSLPSNIDLGLIKSDADKTYRNNIWYQELRQLEISYENFKFIDFADNLNLEDYNKYYLDCEGHYSKIGHSELAKYISKSIKK